MNEARNVLESIVDEFSVEKFNLFFRRKTTNYYEIMDNSPHLNDEDFSHSLKLGEIKFENGDQIVIYLFRVKKPLSERSGKKAQYEKAKRVLRYPDNRVYSAGIFIYFDDAGNFRFSLIYFTSEGIKRLGSNFKRYTYFVGKDLSNKTFLYRIEDGVFSSLEQVKESFSVEPVTNQFFLQFREYFEKTKKEFESSNRNYVCLWLKDNYSDEEYNQQINKFTYTFLGRIIFMYFLQRKGWIENEPNFLSKNLDKSSLYQNLLEPLFFEVFAIKESDRKESIKNQYKDTPYLNGGLFERSELERNLHQKGNLVLFRDEFIRDLIVNFFDSYNFTVDENTPDDKEVSIDPEMLGKVFENTLAEEERGQKGTFYTPREIVHVMVKDSLLRFLINETDIDKNKLHQFVFDLEEFNDIGFNKEEIRLMDSKLEQIKVLDPAVGSGAFPVEMMQVLVYLRKQLSVRVGTNINEVSLKKQFIKENLYGVDIDPGAIEVAKLRLWLALIVDYQKYEAEPLPNLDFKFRVGNSLQEKIEDIDIFSTATKGYNQLFEEDSKLNEMKYHMISIKDKFYQSENETEKAKLKDEFDDIEHNLIHYVIEEYRQDFETYLKAHYKTQMEGSKYAQNSKYLKETLRITEKIEIIEAKIKAGTYKLFKPDFHFSEVYDRKDENNQKIWGFDIVIGNPPYGVKVDNDIKEDHQLGSKDSYGVFISTTLKRFLKKRGVLSFIISDTWLTIKTHKQLRQQVLENQLHKIIRLNQDCFDATVNACIMLLTKSGNTNGQLLVADLTNISTRKEIEELRQKLYGTERFIGHSTPKFAIFHYFQDLIKTNSNLPIFVANPRLFSLMNDKKAKTRKLVLQGKYVDVRQIEMNDNTIEIVKLGDIADIKQGLATGDNKNYLFQNPLSRGSYRSIEGYKEFLLDYKDLEEITLNDDLRVKIINRGFHKSRSEKNFDPDLWFDGKYIVPYDKGGESDTETGWLPNYYVPTNYYIDWSQDAVNRMKSLTIKERDGKGANRICSRFQNADYYFKKGITFSIVGQYSPSFRIGLGNVFDVRGSYIFAEFDNYFLLGVLSSKLIKFLFKGYIINSVGSEIDSIKQIPVVLDTTYGIAEPVSEIIEKQKKDPYYDYMSNEQKKIDRLVYEIYGLNDRDIREVETWYARRYPKLARFCDV